MSQERPRMNAYARAVALGVGAVADGAGRADGDIRVGIGDGAGASFWLVHHLPLGWAGGGTLARRVFDRVHRWGEGLVSCDVAFLPGWGVVLPLPYRQRGGGNRG